jgi:predicted metal-binding membrane protein
VNSRRVFVGVSAIVFAASVAMTIASCASMAAMGDMEMPGGWALSMMWMRMPGQSWLGAAASFVGLWLAMTVAMMLPSLTPLLWRYGQAIGGTDAGRVGQLTALVAVGYFFVWALVGMIVFPLGVALAAVLMREPALARAVPIVVGATVVVAGVLQRTGWKARQLALCRQVPGRGITLGAEPGTAWRYGLCLGLHCVRSCAGLTAVVLGLGVMDVRVMAAVSAAITAERLAPNGERVARVIGAIAVGAGSVVMLLLARARL